MKINKLDKIFLVCAILLAVFMQLPYISGLYYDHDVALRAYMAIKALTSAQWHLLARLDNKPPGVIFIFQLAFFLFGKSFIAIQVFSLIFNLLSVFLLYLLGKYLLSKETRFYFLLPLFFSLFCAHETLQGHTSQSETFMAPFAIAGILCLGLAVKKKKEALYMISGLSLGFGFIIAPYAVAVFIAALVFLLILRAPFRQVILLALSFIAPLLLVCAYFLFLGVFADFFEFVFLGGFRYVENISRIREIYYPLALQALWKGLKAGIVIFGLFALVGIRRAFGKEKSRERLLVACWFSLSAVIALYFLHHFIFLVSSFLSLSVLGISDAWGAGIGLLRSRRAMKNVFVAIMLIVLAYPFYDIILRFVREHRLKGSFLLTEKYARATDKSRYLPLLIRESFDAGRGFLAAQYIRERALPGDRVFIWGDLGGGAIYVWIGRYNGVVWYSKSPFLPEESGVPITVMRGRNSDYAANQKKMLATLKKELPRYIITVESLLLARPDNPYTLHKPVELEKGAFKDFFDILERDYAMEKEIMGCRVYKLVNPPQQNPGLPGVGIK